MDLSQDVAATLSEMGPSGQEDDDELMAELEAMMGEDQPGAPAVAPVAATMPVPTVSAAVLAQLPKAPQGPAYSRLNVPVPAGSVLLGA